MSVLHSPMCARTYTARQILTVVCGVLIIALLIAMSFVVPVHSSVTALAAKLQAFGVGGAMLFVLLSFPLARHLLSRRVQALVKHRRILRVVTEIINEEGWRMVLLVRVSGIVPFGLQNYTFGVTRIAFGPYLLASSVGVLPSILLYAGVGAVGNAAGDSSAGNLRLALLTVAVLAGIAVIAITARKVRVRLAQHQP